MRAAKFCSDCGEETKSRRSFLPSRVYCVQCAPRFRIARLAIAALVILCAGAGFLAGWYAKPNEPFYFIGTPVDLASSRTSVRQNDSDKNDAASARSEAQIPKLSAEIETTCGAPTKSGRPCRRKVRGGGYCYQHKDKFPPKQMAAGHPAGKQ